jgi:hypothetical protein
VIYQLERSVAGSNLEILPAGSDTVILQPGARIPLDVPLLDVRGNLLAVGNGVPGCVRLFSTDPVESLGRRCFDELPRAAMPKSEREDFERTMRGRIATPDSLPRLRAVRLGDSTVAVQAFKTSELASWVELPLHERKKVHPRLLHGETGESYLSPRSLLIVHDDVQGIRIEVIRVGSWD